MRRIRLSLAPAALLSTLMGLSLASAPEAASAHGQHATHRAAAAQSKAGGTITLKLADTVLRDQDGQNVRLMSDLMGQRVTVVDFVYTTCTTVCPVLSATLAALQRELGPRLGKDVQLVSITVDPLRDTPARLKAYSARHEAGSGWRWLTGSKSDVDRVLQAFGAYTPDPESHPAMVMIGDAEGRTWTRLLGFPSVAELQAQVELALSTHAARQN